MFQYRECPACGYDMSSLQEFRCPECGKLWKPHQLLGSRQKRWALYLALGLSLFQPDFGGGTLAVIGAWAWIASAWVATVLWVRSCRTKELIAPRSPLLWVILIACMNLVSPDLPVWGLVPPSLISLIAIIWVFTHLADKAPEVARTHAVLAVSLVIMSLGFFAVLVGASLSAERGARFYVHGDRVEMPESWAWPLVLVGIAAAAAALFGVLWFFRATRTGEKT